MKLTYYGHACFSVEAGGCRMVFDPFITPNPLAGALKLEQVEADVILVTHGHADHLADCAALAKRTGAPVVAAYEVAEWLLKQGVPAVMHVNHGGTAKLPKAVTAKMVPAIHSSTLPDGSPGGNPGGYVVTTPEGCFYYSGDTALTMDMKLIAEEVSLRFAVLPVGDTFTMGPKDAARAAQFCGARRVVGVHYDTFPPIALDKAAARAAFEAAGVELLLPAIGETVVM